MTNTSSHNYYILYILTPYLTPSGPTPATTKQPACFHSIEKIKLSLQNANTLNRAKFSAHRSELSFRYTKAVCILSHNTSMNFCRL